MNITPLGNNTRRTLIYSFFRFRGYIAKIIFFDKTGAITIYKKNRRYDIIGARVFRYPVTFLFAIFRQK